MELRYPYSHYHRWMYVFGSTHSEQLVTSQTLTNHIQQSLSLMIHYCIAFACMLYRFQKTRNTITSCNNKKYSRIQTELIGVFICYRVGITSGIVVWHLNWNERHITYKGGTMMQALQLLQLVKRHAFQNEVTLIGEEIKSVAPVMIVCRHQLVSK